MTFLLDTNVVSETRRRTPDRNVLAWFDDTDQQALYISVLTIGELTKGIARRRRGDPRSAAGLEHWLRGIEELFSDRVIPIDTSIATAWCNLDAGRPIPVIDSLLAATAKVRGFTLVTRNVKDIEPTGVACLNPWDSR